MAKKANFGLLAAIGAGLVFLITRKGDKNGTEGDSSTNGTDEGNDNGGNGETGETGGNGGNGETGETGETGENGENGHTTANNGFLATAILPLAGPTPYGADCNPPSSEYDVFYWDATQPAGGQDAWRAAHLERLGYASGQISSRTNAFQQDYNLVSRGPYAENLEGHIGGTMGQVTENGNLDACTLNALRFAVEVYGGMEVAESNPGYLAGEWAMIVGLSRDAAAQDLA